MSSPLPNILSIAGSDPSGGAGIQADLKSIAALGGFGMAVVTALTAQNTRGVTGVHVVPPSFVRQQLDTLADDVRIDAVKVGMLGSAELVTVVQEFITEKIRVPVVIDPVMVSTSGSPLLDDDAVSAMCDFLPTGLVITPNLPEAAALADELGLDCEAGHDELAIALAKRFDVAVLLKGGHLEGQAMCRDVLAHAGEISEFTAERVATDNTHGTGCSLSSAIATLLGQGSDLSSAVHEAKTWLTGALLAGDRLAVGEGPGPVHHTHRWF